jgi:hypothetical protein
LSLKIKENESPYLKNFSKLFFEIAWKRTSNEEKGKLFTILFSKLKIEIDSILLKFILEILEFSNFEEIKKNEKNKNILLGFFKDFMLCQHNFSIEQFPILNLIHRLIIPEGLSLNSLKTIVGTGLSYSDLIKYKVILCTLD